MITVLRVNKNGDGWTIRFAKGDAIVTVKSRTVTLDEALKEGREDAMPIFLEMEAFNARQRPIGSFKNKRRATRKHLP